MACCFPDQVGLRGRSHTASLVIQLGDEPGRSRGGPRAGGAVFWKSPAPPLIQSAQDTPQQCLPRTAFSSQHSVLILSYTRLHSAEGLPLRAPILRCAC